MQRLQSPVAEVLGWEDLRDAVEAAGGALAVQVVKVEGEWLTVQSRDATGAGELYRVPVEWTQHMSRLH